MKFIDLYNYNNGRLDLFSEDTIKDIRKRTGEPRKTRSKPVISKLVDVNKSWVLTFESNAITSTNVSSYEQTVKPTHPPTGIPTLVKVRSAFSSDVVISCSCLDFRYFGLAYFAKHGDYGSKRVGRKYDLFPKIKNKKPSERGTCKHLENTLSTIPFLSTSILRMYKDKYGM